MINLTIFLFNISSRNGFRADRWRYVQFKLSSRQCSDRTLHRQWSRQQNDNPTRVGSKATTPDYGMGFASETSRVMSTCPSSRFQADELVIMRVFRSKWKQPDYLFQLVSDKTLNLSPNISISTDMIINRSVGENNFELCGYRVSIRRPTLTEYLTHLRRNTAATSPKVLLSMFYSLGIARGMKILEAGSGSGIATLILSYLVGEDGHITTFERAQKNFSAAKRNFDRWATSCKVSRGVEWPENVEFCKGDISNFMTDKKFDLVFLDVSDLNRTLGISSCFLKDGGILAFFAPSISKLVDINKAVIESRLPLILESVFEETDTRWQFVFKDSLMKLGWPEKNEALTAFFAKFRKISEENFSDVGVTVDGSSDIFAEGDSAMIHFTDAKKSGRIHETICALLPKTEFYNDFGKLASADVVGKRVGMLHRSSAGFPFYCSRPSLEERFRVSRDVHMSSLNKHVALSLLLIGLQRGQKIMIIEDSNSLLMTAVMLLETVLPSGITILFSKPEFKQNSENFFDWNKCCHELKSVMKCNVLDICPSLRHIQPSPESEEFNESCDGAYIHGQDLEKCLHSAHLSLKRNGRLAVLCTSFVELNQAIDIVQRLPFDIVDVHEHVDRPWIIQPIGIQRKMLPIDAGNAPYICRPKQRLDMKMGYIMIARKNDC